MNTTNKSLNEVFQTLRDLVKSPGYLYVLLFMIEEDICIPFSQLKEADPQIRLSMKEAAMLVGLYINENNDVLKEPNNIDSLFDLRAKTYQVLDELHWAMNEPDSQFYVLGLSVLCTRTLVGSHYSSHRLCSVAPTGLIIGAPSNSPEGGEKNCSPSVAQHPPRGLTPPPILCRPNGLIITLHDHGG